MTTWGTYLLVGVVGASCGRASTGIYRLEQSTMSNSCERAPPEGDMGLVDVFEESGGYRLPVVDDGAGAFRTVVRTSYSVSPRSSTTQLGGCDGQVIERTITSQLGNSGSPIEATLKSHYDVPDGCRAPGRPAKSCDVTQQLRYHFVSSCESPCHISVGETPSQGLSCLCPFSEGN